MFIGLIIVGVTLQHELHWIGESDQRCAERQEIDPSSSGPLIGGGVFYLGIVAATGVLQTVSSIFNMSAQNN